MRHNLSEFKKSVSRYKKILAKKRNVAVFFTPDALLSIAPLSMAVHELGGDLFVSCNSGESERILRSIWNSDSPQLKKFISFTERKAVGFSKLFERPDIVLKSGKKGFTGDLDLPFETGWYKPIKSKQLDKTSKLVWKNVFAVKKGERVSVRFELMTPDCQISDLLDSFHITQSMIKSVDKEITLRASTSRKTVNIPSEKVSDLLSTLMGCELSKFSNEKVFKLFKKVSNEFSLSKLAPPDLVFGIVGKGLGGRHLFGEAFGYPSPNGKTRWDSPGGILYKFPWLPQSNDDPRPPRTRIGFTQTIPVEEFIGTNDIDWILMRKKNMSLQKIFQKCNRVEVKGIKTKHGRTEFTVWYQKKDGSLRGIKRSDSDAKSIVDPDMLKETGKKFGMMANIPGGECFLTPERVKGRIIGDVVIAIDDSYRLSGSNPLVIDVNGNYKIISGPERIVSELRSHLRHSMDKIKRQEKNGHIPKSIIRMKKDNFRKIGEFAINTNENAKLSRYLIVNEKIADMIHVALGSGFDADTATEYHCDIVINSPRQKLDVTAYDRHNKPYPIIKRGRILIKA